MKNITINNNKGIPTTIMRAITSMRIVGINWEHVIKYFQYKLL